MGSNLSQAVLNRQVMGGMDGMDMGEEAMEEKGVETMDTIHSDVDAKEVIFVQQTNNEDR